jgi:lipoprotein-releasing system permease protein
VLVRGMRAGDLQQLTSIAQNIRHGSLEGFDKGRALRSVRGLLISCHCVPATASPWWRHAAAVTPMGTAPRINPYKIAAVFEIGMSEYDAGIVFMPLPEAARLISTASTTSQRSRYSTHADRIASSLSHDGDRGGWAACLPG